MDYHRRTQPYDPKSPSHHNPALPSSLLMPSVDLGSPCSPRRPFTTYSTPLLDSWDFLPPPVVTPTVYTTPATPRETWTTVKACSPYGSPSNPFRYHGTTPSIPQRRSTINLARAIQRVTGIPSRSARRPPVGWKEHFEVEPNHNRAGQMIFRVVFWAALVVYLTALMGIGAPADVGVVEIKTRAWNRHVAEPSGVGKIGWKGVEMVDRVAEMGYSRDMGRGIQGIWDVVEELKG